MASETPRRVILDVDVGTDDYLALLIFLFAEKINRVKIEAILCTTGNTSMENVCTNVLRLLEITKRTDIPIYKGASKQLIPPDFEIDKFHGSDGFGDLQHDHFPELTVAKSEPAALALGKLITENPNEITLICVAPLTNVALALRLYDDFANCLKDLWIMGGNHTAIGNTTSAAEYNFFVDPEAAFIVLETVKSPIYILTWETCLQSTISFDWRFNIFGQMDNPAIELLNKAEKKVYKNNYNYWLPCDAFLAAAFLYPQSIIKKKSCHNVTIELHGSKTRGQMVLDHLKTKENNVTIIEQICEESFKELLLKLN